MAHQTSTGILATPQLAQATKRRGKLRRTRWRRAQERQACHSRRPAQEGWRQKQVFAGWFFPFYPIEQCFPCLRQKPISSTGDRKRAYALSTASGHGKL